jgi:two-component system chemotaxis response regulator CheB
LKEAHPWRFRCHTGHAYSAASLVAAVNQGIDDALWNAIRALEEGGLLLAHLSAHGGDAVSGPAAEALIKHAGEARRISEEVRQLAANRELFGAPDFQR